jgi:photosystem II stability/assembly factor-like uncharacterized protein
MKRVFIAIIVLSFSKVTFAQTWESTAGPGGSEIRSGVICPNGNIYIAATNIHRSTDNGLSWDHIGAETGPSTYQILCSPTTGSLFTLSDGHLWRSQNRGDSWVNLFPVLTPANLTISPSGQISILSGPTFSFSTDDGETWHGASAVELWWMVTSLTADHDGVIYSHINTNLYRLVGGTKWTKIFESPLQIRPVRPGLVTGFIGDQLYSSLDSGESWSMFFKADATIKDFLAISRDTFFLMIDGSILRSVDGGNQWSDLSKDLPFNYSALGLLGISSTSLYILTPSTLYRCDDGGEWRSVTVPTGKVMSITATRSGKLVTASLYAGGIAAGRVWLLEDNHWYRQSDEAIKMVASDSAGLMYGIISKMFATSSDDGKTWVRKEAFEGDQFRITLTRDAIYVASLGGGLHQSFDKGESWQQIKSIGLSNYSLTAIAVAEPTTLYIGGFRKFMRSPDLGETWEKPVFPFISGSENVSAIVAHDSIVVVGVNKTGIYFSTDYGDIWENHSEGLGLDTINQLLATPSGAVFAATTSGVYEYTPSTQTWANVNDGLLFGNILSLALGADGKVYAGTDGDGVYRSMKTYGSWFNSSVAHDVYLPDDVSIYPNPASTEITIGFRSGKPEKYRTAIYNLLGESILTGSNEETIDVSALGSGQYFLRVITDDTIQTLPLSIVR